MLLILLRTPIAIKNRRQIRRRTASSPKAVNLRVAKNLVAWRKSLHAVEILHFVQDDNSTNAQDAPGKTSLCS
jgi:hypothetical protein